jgi:hypothetical protein
LPRSAKRSTTAFALGKFILVHEHADCGLTLYGPARRTHPPLLAEEYFNVPKTTGGAS